MTKVRIILPRAFVYLAALEMIGAAGFVVMSTVKARPTEASVVMRAER